MIKHPEKAINMYVLMKGSKISARNMKLKVQVKIGKQLEAIPINVVGMYLEEYIVHATPIAHVTTLANRYF